jgi:hypothetical protein
MATISLKDIDKKAEVVAEANYVPGSVDISNNKEFKPSLMSMMLMNQQKQLSNQNNT